MTKFPDIFSALATPFDNVKTKRGPNGTRLSYITARQAMNRLDEVVGPENWWDDYFPLPNSVICKLTIRLPDGQVLTKSDAGGHAGMQDEGDDEKSGFSDSFKRAAVKFGVGRYLYQDGIPAYKEGHEPSPKAAPAAKAEPPKLHRPDGEAPAKTAWDDTPIQIPANFNVRKGKDLFGWLKDQHQRYQRDILKFVQKSGTALGFPDKVVDWDAEQVKRGLAIAVRKLIEVSDEAPQGEPEVIALNRLAATPSASSPGGRMPTLGELRLRLITLIGQCSKIINPGKDGEPFFMIALQHLESELGVKMPGGDVTSCEDRAILERFIAAAQVFFNTNGERVA